MKVNVCEISVDLQILSKSNYLYPLICWMKMIKKKGLILFTLKESHFKAIWFESAGMFYMDYIHKY